jgi:serine/threonine-protein kinase
LDFVSPRPILANYWGTSVIVQANGMADQSPKQYLALLQKSGLVSPEQWATHLAQLVKKFGPNPNRDQVTKYFVDAHLITPWHDEKLRCGKFRGFFLGKFKLLGFLGSGGMCSVYLAEHSIMRQPRAIKVLPKNRVADKSYLDRFYREGRAAAALSHPNIVRVYDIDHEGENHYLVMEYVEGINLYDLVKRDGRLSYRKAVDYILQAAIGLQHAHEAKLVHRDVKPANLLVTSGDIVKVLDMGLALFREDDFSVTIANQEKVLGTADYLAPEQAVNSHEVDHRADIYGLGCSMYYLLTGQPPFPQGTLPERIIMHQTKAPPPIENFRPDCPKRLSLICQKMLQKDRERRFQDCRALARQLRVMLDELAGQSDKTKVAARQAAVGASAGAVAKAPLSVGGVAPAKSVGPGSPGSGPAARQLPSGTGAAPRAAPVSTATPKPRIPNASPPAPVAVNGFPSSKAAVAPADLMLKPIAKRRKRGGTSAKEQLILAGVVGSLLAVLGLAVFLALKLG